MRRAYQKDNRWCHRPTGSELGAITGESLQTGAPLTRAALLGRRREWPSNALCLVPNRA
jgi:hypothetical protein